MVPSTVVLPPKPIGTDAELVGLLRQALFQGGQLGVGVGLIQLAEEGLFGGQVGGAAVAADGDAQDAGGAALALRLVHSVQHHLAHACQVTPGAQPAVRQGILGADVLAAAAFEHQVDGQRIAFHFFEVDGGEV